MYVQSITVFARASHPLIYSDKISFKPPHLKHINYTHMYMYKKPPPTSGTAYAGENNNYGNKF